MLYLCKSKEEKALGLLQRKQCIQKLIENEFPFKLYIFSFSLNVFFSVTAIGFQALAVSVQASNYFVYAGYWVGGIMLIGEFIGLIVVFKRKFMYFQLAMYVHSVTALISTALMITNTHGLVNANDEQKNYRWINAVLLAIALLSKISLFILVFNIKRKMKKYFKSALDEPDISSISKIEFTSR